MEKDIKYYLHAGKAAEKGEKKPLNVDAEALGANSAYEILHVFYVERKGVLLERPVAYMIRNIKKSAARIYTEETAIKLMKSLSFAMAIKNARVKSENGKEQIIAMEGYPDIEGDFYKIVVKDGKYDKKLENIATVIELNPVNKTKVNSKVTSFSNYISQYFIS